MIADLFSWQENAVIDSFCLDIRDMESVRREIGRERARERSDL